ncbi:helix-turn-helix domain-containing protein [Marinospirillum sp. MEB164]|uniref:Helix-turn-helix domain-containing protein n=1 Tax=Marinospirillum alkalitolerans TaxID=3123374 RepID=A0ABW8PVD9_9GAMM
MQQNTTHTAPEQSFLTVKATASRFGVSPATVWRWVRNGRFPAPVRLSDNCTRWRIADITAWENSLETA